MFGTGEFASSSSESTMPSRTSSSWSVGTYWRQIGSPGDLIRSTIAGEIRNSKLSTAWRSRAMSSTCSAPNRAASASSEAMLFLRSSSCQVSIRQILGVDHQIVPGRVVTRDGAGPGEAACFIEAARGRVIRPRRCLDHHQPAAVRRQPAFRFSKQLRADARALAFTIHDDPVQIPGRFRAGCRAPACIADQVLTIEGADEAIVVGAALAQAGVEQLDRGRDLFLTKE